MTFKRHSNFKMVPGWFPLTTNLLNIEMSESQLNLITVGGGSFLNTCLNGSFKSKIPLASEFQKD